MPDRNRPSRFNTHPIVQNSIRIAALAVSLLFTAPAVAQVLNLDITPQPATPDEEIRLFAALPALSCFNELTNYTVSSNERSLVVEFVVREAESPICGTPPPLFLDINLGRFETGTYQLQITGVLPADPFEPVSTEFEVLLGDSATAVPTLSRAALWLLLAAMAAIAVITLQNFRKTKV